MDKIIQNFQNKFCQLSDAQINILALGILSILSFFAFLYVKNDRYDEPIPGRKLAGQLFIKKVKEGVYKTEWIERALFLFALLMLVLILCSASFLIKS